MLIDLTTLPAFLLMVASLARLFRALTGASGMAWVPWFSLALLSAPLIQITTLFSADLMYAAAFLALNTQLFLMSRGSRPRPLDCCLAAAAVGLLLGTKTTGAISAAVLLGVYGIVAATRWRRLFRTASAAPLSAGVVLGAVVLMLAAGGVWPVRNWINYGSPLAPSGLELFGVSIFPGDTMESTRYYLSVLKDMRDVKGYNLASRTAHYLREWMGAWYLPSTLLVLALLGDAWRARRHGDATEQAAARLTVVLCSVVVTAVHLALLVQVPWSSLEWTRGLSLRYGLPLVVLWAFLPFCAAFPLSAAWWRRLPLEAHTSRLFGGIHQRMPAWVKRPQATGGGAALLVAGIVAVLAVQTAAADGRVRAVADRRAVALRGCNAETHAPGVHERAYLAVLDHEQRTGACRNRRFFVTTRFDAPMALQPVPYSNFVYDARPRTIVERAFAAHGPGTKPCDYVIASEAEMNTERGNLLVRRLEAEGVLELVSLAGPYRIYTARRR